MDIIKSRFKELASIEFPSVTNTRVQMMPIKFDNLLLLPEQILHYVPMLSKLIELSDYKSDIGYITIDEKFVEAGKFQRRPGIHVDDYSWGGGSGGGTVWGSRGMLLASNIEGCKAWNQDVFGKPELEGDCKHLENQLLDENCTTLKANTVYWLDGKCIHESIPVKEDCIRQFVRLSNPNNCDWYDGYTENPYVKAPGNILPKRVFINN